MAKRAHLRMAAMKDDLIAAVIRKLPDTNKEFSGAARESWLAMMRNTFAMTYGAVAESEAPAPFVVSPVAAAAPPVRYTIAQDGFAYGDGKPIDASDIVPGSVVHDYRGQPVDPEMDPILWRSHGALPARLPRGVRLVPADDLAEAGP